MKTYEELKNMGIDFNSLERERQALRSKQKTINSFNTLAFLIAISSFFFINKHPYLFMSLITISSIFIIIYQYINTRLYKQLMKNIMNEFFRKQNLDLVYGDLSKRREIKKYTSFLLKNSTSFLLNKLLIIESLGLLKPLLYSKSIYDIISGSLNGQPFVMSNVRLTEVKRKTLFKGIVGIIQTSANYPYTIIMPNQLKRDFAENKKFVQPLNFASLNQKNIYFKEDSDFEKSFAVKSKDKHFARNIVTAPLKEYLKEIAKNNKVYFVLVHDKIIFASNRRLLFRLSLEKSLDDAELKSIYDDFAEFYQIMEKIYSLITKSHSSDAPPVSF